MLSHPLVRLGTMTEHDTPQQLTLVPAPEVPVPILVAAAAADPSAKTKNSTSATEPSGSTAVALNIVDAPTVRMAPAAGDVTVTTGGRLPT